MDCVRFQTIGWFVGNRDAKTFEQFYEKLNLPNHVIVYTDDWDVYNKVIPDCNHVFEKVSTTQIEQNNSNVRHFAARFTRRTKVVSKSIEMINATLKVLWFLNEAGGYQQVRKFCNLSFS